MHGLLRLLLLLHRRSRAPHARPLLIDAWDSRAGVGLLCIALRLHLQALGLELCAGALALGLHQLAVQSGDVHRGQLGFELFDLFFRELWLPEVCLARDDLLHESNLLRLDGLR